MSSRLVELIAIDVDEEEIALSQLCTFILPLRFRLKCKLIVFSNEKFLPIAFYKHFLVKKRKNKPLNQTVCAPNKENKQQRWQKQKKMRRAADCRNKQLRRCVIGSERSVVNDRSRRGVAAG